MFRIAIFFSGIFLIGCSDSNSRPIYGSDSNLPVNCRAYIEDAINYYESEIEPYKYKTLDLDGYCSDDWHSNRCQDHLHSIGEALEVKTNQADLLNKSLRKHCGLDGDLWDN